MSRAYRAFEAIDREREAKKDADLVRFRALLARVLRASEKMDFHEQVRLGVDDIRDALK